VSTEPNTYDEVPYASFPFPQTHINRLATVATLFGMQPQSITACRTLELGCASGGNLIPMAAALPKSRFVGVDFAASQIDEARKTADQLGLENLQLQVASILDLADDIGPFDYIICHGVWSWVSAPVREKILTICQKQLAPQGVAYISYNAYPGWHMRANVREMMVYHTRNFATAKDRAGHARALLDFLVRSVPATNNAYSLLLKSEMEALRKSDDSYLLHEHLESVNEPMYFHEFESQASAKGLQYLGESDVGAMLTAGLPAEVDSILNYLASSMVEREQYLDFLRNRMFRQTLLCRQGLTLNWRPDYERMRRLYVSSGVVVPDGEFDPTSTELMEFRGTHGTAKTPDRGMKVALRALAQMWPEAIRLDQLHELVQSQLHSSGAADAVSQGRDALMLAKGLLDCYVSRFVELTAEPPQCTARPGEQPRASELARLQAASGLSVTNANHRIVHLDAISRQFVLLCDGNRSKVEILDELAKLVEGGAFEIHDSAGAVPDASRTRAVLTQMLDSALAQLVRNAVMVG